MKHVYLKILVVNYALLPLAFGTTLSFEYSDSQTYNESNGQCIEDSITVFSPKAPDNDGRIRELDASQATADAYCQKLGYDMGLILSKNYTKKTRRSSYNANRGSRCWRWDSQKTREKTEELKCVIKRCIHIDSDGYANVHRFDRDKRALKKECKNRNQTR